MDDHASIAPLQPHVRLGIRGLPGITQHLITGGLYVLVAETAATRFPLLASFLGTSLGDGRPVTLVLPGQPEAFVQRLEGLGGLPLNSSLTSGKCQLLVTQSELPKRMFRYGPERFVQELERFEVQDGSVLIFDQADDLISLHDLGQALEQVAILSQWLERHKVTALLLLLRVTETHAAILNALMDGLSGMARLGSDGDGLRLMFDYWQGPDATIAARTFGLRSTASGLYEVSSTSGEAVSTSSEAPAPAPPGPARALEPRDQTYFYMDADLEGLASVLAGRWQRVDSLVGLMHAIRKERAPIIIFCYRKDTALRELAESVHALRVNLGPHAQLIVQEKDASLRYQNEALLLRLGLNLVIHRDVPLTRFPLLLDSVAGQIFNRDVDIDFEAALSSVSPTSLRGYQSPASFVREVRELLGRSVTLNIPYVLITGLPLQQQDMLEILRMMRISRAGDLVTADSRYCYLFLNACQQGTALGALERILGARVDQVFEDVKFMVLASDVETALESLLQNAKAGAALDYTPQLVVASRAQPATTAPVSGEPEDPVAESRPRHAVRARGTPSSSHDPASASTADTLASNPVPATAAAARPVAQRLAPYGAGRSSVTRPEGNPQSPPSSGDSPASSGGGHGAAGSPRAVRRNASRAAGA